MPANVGGVRDVLQQAKLQESRRAGLIRQQCLAGPCHLCKVWSHRPPGQSCSLSSDKHTALPSWQPVAAGQPGFLEKEGCCPQGGWGYTEPIPGLRWLGRAAWGPAALRPLEQPAGAWARPAWGTAPNTYDTPTAPSECLANLGRVPLWGHRLRTSWVQWGVRQGQRTRNMPRLSADLELHMVTIKYAPVSCSGNHPTAPH